jgi:UDP-glucose 4-epimerase
MTRVLVTGSAGFLGRNLTAALVAAGHAVTLVDRAGRDAPLGTQALALTDQAALFELLCAQRIEVVVHLACGLLPSSGEEAFAREQHDVIAPSFALMDRCAEAGIRFVLMSSGGTVYGDTDVQRVREEQPLAPKNLYGFSKLVLEQYALLCHRRLGLRYLILRPSNLYGPHQRLGGAQGIVAVAMGRVIGGEPLEVWGDGSAVRDYLDVRDWSAAVVALIAAGVAQRTLNVGSGIGHSINDVLALVRATTGHDLPVQYRPARGLDVRAVVLDTQALAACIPWAPRPLAAGIHDFWQWLSTHGH